MGEKVSAKERAESLRKVYALAQKNKSEDRLTAADIKQAKKVLNYKEPKKAADYSGIKDYGELSKGGQIKPIKAVGGILAGMAAGVAPGLIGLGYMAHKKAKKKKAKATLEAQAGMAAVPKTMNKGGGMDMGRKPVKAGMGGMLKKVFGSSDIFKITGASSANPKFLNDFKQYKDNDTASRFQKTTNAKQVKSGGEIVVGKGSDYIKDLID